jgi:hypothetical protein
MQYGHKKPRTIFVNTIGETTEGYLDSCTTNVMKKMMTTKMRRWVAKTVPKIIDILITL